MLALLITSCILSGVLGRLGGWEHGNKLYRRLCIPLLSALLLLIMGCFSPYLLLMVGLMAGALSTYHDYIGFDSFFLHGFVIGLSLTPIAYATGHWISFSLVVVLYTLWMGLWSKFTHWDVLEEFGRYAIIPLGVWLLFNQEKL